MTEHTPTPWMVHYTEVRGRLYGVDSIRPVNEADEPTRSLHGQVTSISSSIVKFTGLDQDEANAKFIVRAVNCHDELVDALEEIIKRCPFVAHETGVQAIIRLDQISKARAALAKAGAA